MKIKENSRFRRGKVSGIIFERLPPEYWDRRNDPEYVVQYDIGCGGDTKCEPESKLRRFEITPLS